MAAPAESEGKPSRKGFSIGFNAVPAVLLVVLAALIVLYLIPANSYLIMPGNALNVESMIDIKGHPDRSNRGTLYMTDVSMYKADHYIEELWGRVQPNTDIEPAPSVAGNLTPSQYTQYSLEMMTNSVQDAEAAALSQTAHYKPHYARTGPKIVFLVPHLPASRVLRVGDVVEGVDSHRTRRAAQVGIFIKQRTPGKSVRLTILRGKRLLHVVVATVPSTNGTPNKHGKTPLIGIVVQDQIVFPIHISIRTGAIGGPSAGLMFALGIVQRLSPTDVTKGCKVAGTGTIDFAGNVGEIGGAAQKIVAARNVGAQYFLVPDVPANLDPVLAHRGSVEVVPVKTLGQALRFLRSLKPCR